MLSLLPSVISRDITRPSLRGSMAGLVTWQARAGRAQAYEGQTQWWLGVPEGGVSGRVSYLALVGWQTRGETRNEESSPLRDNPIREGRHHGVLELLYTVPGWYYQLRYGAFKTPVPTRGVHCRPLAWG